MPPHSLPERIEKRLEKIEEKIDVIMSNCLPTLQGKLARHDGMIYVMMAVLLIILGLLVKLVWG